MSWFARLLPVAVAVSVVLACLIAGSRLKFFSNFRAQIKKSGFKGAIRHYGWRMFALLFLFYLVRDLTLYVALPWMVARGLLN